MTAVLPLTFVSQAIVDEYLTAHSHAESQRAAELEKSEVGVQVSRLLGEFDAIRDMFDLRGTMKKPSKLEMYTKMVTMPLPLTTPATDHHQQPASYRFQQPLLTSAIGPVLRCRWSLSSIRSSLSLPACI